MEPEANKFGSGGNYSLDVSQVESNKSTFINDNFVDINNISEGQKEKIETNKISSKDYLNQTENFSETDSNEMNSPNEECPSQNCNETTGGILPCDLIKVEIDNEHNPDTCFDRERFVCKTEPKENESGSDGNYSLDASQVVSNKSTCNDDVNFVDINNIPEEHIENDINKKILLNDYLNQSQDSLETDSNKLNSIKEEILSRNHNEMSIGILPFDLLKVEIDNKHDQDTCFDSEEEYKPKLVLSRRKLMSDEKLKEAREKDRIRQLERRKNMSEEQLAAFREKQKLIAREKRKNLQGEKLLEVREKQRIRAIMKRATMSEEKLKERRERDKLRAQEKRRNMDMEKMIEFREKQRIQAQEKRKNYSEEKLKEIRERERIRAKERRQSLSKEKLEEIREKDKIRAQEKRKAQHLTNILLQSLENPFEHILNTHSHFISSNHSNIELESTIPIVSEIKNSSMLKDNDQISSKGLCNEALESNNISDMLGINSKVNTINPDVHNELVSNIENSDATSDTNSSTLATSGNSEYESVIEKTNTTLKYLIDIAQQNQN